MADARREQRQTNGNARTSPGQSNQTTTSADEVYCKIERGSSDPFGNRVARVYVKTEDFAIYSTDEPAVGLRRPRYYLTCGPDRGVELRQRLNCISGSMHRINDLLVGMQPLLTWKWFYSRQYDAICERAFEHQAHAMQQAFEDHGAEAAPPLARFCREVESCRDSRNKMRYIWANVAAAFLFLVIWYVLRQTGGENALYTLMVETAVASPVIGELEVKLIDLLTLGAIGAFFAVSIGINALRINHSITIPEMFYAGFIRILIGVIAAGTAYLLIGGGWIFTAVDRNYLLWTIYLVAFLAGFSEMLVPNALKRVEQTASPDDAPERPAGPDRAEEAQPAGRRANGAAK